MPEGMPANVSQGFIFRAMGEALNALRAADNVTDLGNIRAQLVAVDADGEPVNRLPKVLRDWTGGPGGLLRGKDVNHLRQHWFGTDSRPTGRSDKIWWQEVQPIDPIIRAGMVELIDRLLVATTDSRTDFFWVCAGHTMEVVILEHDLNKPPVPTPPRPGDKLFTVLILTPTLPSARRLRVPQNEDDYVFGATEPITVVRPPGIGPSEVDSGGAKGGTAVVLKPLSLEKKP